MDNQDLIREINKWDSILPTLTTDFTLYELAFFKIFIKFEKFLSDAFENYAIGCNSVYGYCPPRRLEFDDIQHLHQILHKQNSSFINHYDIVINKSDGFFNDNPFDIIKTDHTYSQTMDQMKRIRDYIAHESDSARNKYVTVVLNGRAYIEPFVHLKTTKRSTQKSYYNYYITSMRIISDFIINAPIAAQPQP